MSKREQIVENIVEVLQNATNPRFGLVTRSNFDVTNLSRQQFPAIWIQTADETKTDESMMTSMTRSSMLEVLLAVYVNGKNIDTLRNDAIEAIEDTLELDRTRGGAARYSRVSEVTVDFDMADMYGKVDVMVEVYYTYPRGQS
tara:strand:+ start:35 stop:463 length:429 start_codon:yes stop_codon:yes gene_type:complete